MIGEFFEILFFFLSCQVNILTVAYLNSNNRELVYIVIGVLINLMTDVENCVVLKEERGVKK
jgi:hypothetical protein